ncbi:MAG TPA: tRNA lysidine(34) synthetase TilS [Candidatus Angelobacter sp.]|nr:tRNA lysidine(34) synthetase TilS [Candidatus Angelobacter sp.]
MSNLAEQVEQTIRGLRLFARGEKILVAVSGGVDSMALLHLLHELSKRNDWRLAVAHLNHQLRGRASDADERLVVGAAKKLGVRVVAGRADVKGIARKGKLSLEMAARKARHEFLAKTARRLKISRVALAHHADDQVELFFLRLLRGSGSEGLAGMKWRNASPADRRIELMRPLLEQSKEALRDYATAQKIRFRDDASNESLDIQRNLIRHELLPLLRRKYQPALARTILRVMEILRAESELIGEISDNWLARAGIDFEQLPLALQRRCIQSQLLRLGIPADFALVERLRLAPRESFTIFPGVVARRNRDGRLHIDSRTGVSPVSPCSHGRDARATTEVRASPASVETTAGRRRLLRVQVEGRAGRTEFGGRRVSWKVQPQKRFRRPESRAGQEVFDADRVGGRIVLRHWRPGDRFQPIGMAKAVKLQDLFVNLKIPRERRHDLIVAATAENHIFWVEDLRISEQFKLTPRTRRQLVWRWKVGENGRLRVSAHHVTLPQH